MPYIPIQLKNGRNISITTLALLDSGADFPLFPAALAKSISIQVEKGTKVMNIGIGGHQVIAYRHQTQLLVNKNVLDVEIDFSNDQETPLLGRVGFFSKFRYIKFMEKQRKVEFLVP